MNKLMVLFLFLFGTTVVQLSAGEEKEREASSTETVYSRAWRLKREKGGQFDWIFNDTGQDVNIVFSMNYLVMGSLPGDTAKGLAHDEFLPVSPKNYGPQFEITYSDSEGNPQRETSSLPFLGNPVHLVQLSLDNNGRLKVNKIPLSEPPEEEE